MKAHYSFIRSLSVLGIGALLLGATAFTTASAQTAGECSVTSTTLVSDASTMVAGTSSKAVDNDTATGGNQVPSAWTASIPGATWIWDDAQNDGTAATGTETFTRTFTWSSDATTTATLMIAADNSYAVEINGIEVASSSDEVNFTLATQDSYDVGAHLVNGTNTIEIMVTNADNGSDNPAGLLYKLAIAGFSCEDDEAMQPVGEIVEPDAGDTVSGTTTLLATYDDGDAINDDSVAWAVRSDGACNDPSKTVFGNTDGHNDSFSWNGMNFSAAIDTTDVANGQYCFVFNPADDAGQDDVRLTSLFTIDNVVTPPGDDDDDQDDEKVTICHIPGGNQAKAKTLTVGENAVQAHLNHGDYEGECTASSSASQANRGNSNRR